MSPNSHPTSVESNSSAAGSTKGVSRYLNSAGWERRLLFSNDVAPFEYRVQRNPNQSTEYSVQRKPNSVNILHIRLNMLNMLQEEGPLLGSKSVCSCLTLEMNSLRRHTWWQSKRFYWEGVPRQRPAGSENPRKLLCHLAFGLGLLWWWGLFSGHLWPAILTQGPSWWSCIAQPRWILVRRTLRLVGIRGWCLRSSFDFLQILLIGDNLLVCIPYQDLFVKTTHASDCYLAWPGWLVSVSVSSNKYIFKTYIWYCYMYWLNLFFCYTNLSVETELMLQVICISINLILSLEIQNPTIEVIFLM